MEMKLKTYLQGRLEHYPSYEACKQINTLLQRVIDSCFRAKALYPHLFSGRRKQVDYQLSRNILYTLKEAFFSEFISCALLITWFANFVLFCESNFINSPISKERGSCFYQAIVFNRPLVIFTLLILVCCFLKGIYAIIDYSVYQKTFSKI